VLRDDLQRKVSGFVGSIEMCAADMQHALLSTYSHMLLLSAATAAALCLYVDAALLTPLLLHQHCLSLIDTQCTGAMRILWMPL
jgi:hypothetical protein